MSTDEVGVFFQAKAIAEDGSLRHALDPRFADTWVLSTALGWRGQPGAPLAALCAVLAWAALTALLALRLRRALHEARA